MANQEPISSSAGDEVISVLIVEDSPEWAELVERVLHAKEEWYTRSVDTMVKARICLAERTWDIIFTDLNLPDSRGLDTLFRLQQEAPTAGFVVMTGMTEEALARQALRAGAQDFLVKGAITASAISRVARYAFERAKLDLQIRQGRQLVAAALDALPACIAILGQDGRIRATNARWTRYDIHENPLVYGHSIGTSYLSVCEEVQMAFPHLSEAAKRIQEVIIGTPERFEDDLYVPSGGGGNWYDLRATRYLDGENRPTIVVSLADISERKELEAELRASKELFSLISNNVLDLMVIFDAQGRRIYSSPSYGTALGYSPEEVAQFDHLALLHPEDVERVGSALASLFTQQTANILDYRLRHRDGHYLWFESRSCMIQGTTPQDRRILVVARDITERKDAEKEKGQMEVRLRQAEKLEAVGQLAAGIAHEINTPTQYIGDNATFLQEAIGELCCFVEGLKADLEEPQSALPQIRQRLQNLDFDYLKHEIPRAIQQTLEGVGRVSKIVAAMKDFSHPGGVGREAIDLNRAIESTVTVSRAEWKYLANMELELDPSLPPVPCFPSELNQVILNLIVNSAHAIEAAQQASGDDRMGCIHIRTRPSTLGIEISVSDTGTGIPSEIRDRIFEPFFTTKPVGKGTGQGLSQAHAVVVGRHGGSLSVESSPGQGATFTIELPLHPGGEV